jgi:hypothetical protein
MNDLHFAVVVGIDNYLGIRDLKFATQDAQAFAEWLKDKDGGAVPNENIEIIVTDTAYMSSIKNVFDAQPTASDVHKAIKKLRDIVNKSISTSPENWYQTRLYIYFSGHGIAPVAKDAALLMANASPTDYGENIACSLLIDYLLKNQPFKEIVIFADCCRQRIAQSAPLGGFPGTPSLQNNGQVFTFVGYATYFGDLAHEPTPTEQMTPDEQRGYFTRALLEGLKGGAPINKAGMIDSSTLSVYVKKRVEELTKNKPRGPQTPTMEGDMGSDPMVFLHPKIGNIEINTFDARLIFVSSFFGKVELHNGNNNVIGYHDNTINSDWNIKLPSGLYRVTIAGTQDGASFRENGYFTIWGENKNVEL